MKHNNMSVIIYIICWIKDRADTEAPSALRQPTPKNEAFNEALQNLSLQIRLQMANENLPNQRIPEFAAAMVSETQNQMFSNDAIKNIIEQAGDELFDEDKWDVDEIKHNTKDSNE